MDIDSWLGDEPEAPPAGPACGSGAVHAGDCELLEMTPADRDPLANTMSEAKQMIFGWLQPAVLQKASCAGRVDGEGRRRQPCVALCCYYR